MSSIYLYKLYGIIAVVVTIAIFIIYSNIKLSAKRRHTTDDYASRIQEMTDFQLKSEIQSLAYRSNKQPIIPEDDILEGDGYPNIQRMQKIAMAEFKRRNLIL